MEKELKPSIRFKGFTEVWEQRKIGDILKSQAINIDLEPSEFAKYEVIQQGNEPIAGYTNKEPFEKYEPIVLFGDHTLSLYKPKSPFLVASDGVKAYFLENVNGNFFYHLLSVNLPKNEGYKRYSSILKDKDFKLTYNRGEEEKISNLFDNLDSLITLHQRKCEKLQNIKKGLLEKMFPANGKNVPEIRFKGFTEVWEQRKAKEVCSITTGKSNTQDQVDDGAYPFYIRSDVPVRSNKYLYDEEAVITIGDGNIGKVFHYVDGKFDLHQRCYKMSDFTELNAKYFYWYFSTKFYKRAMSMTAKATVDSVRLEMIADMDIRYPSKKDEQNKISTLLFNLDSLITLHQRKLMN